MKIIDAHMHYSKIASFAACARDSSLVDYSEAGYLNERQACGIVQSICMGAIETVAGGFPDSNAPTPMLADLSRCLPAGLHICAGINPHRLGSDALAALEQAAKTRSIVGFKLYAGYYHVDVNDPIYTPIYRLAEKYGLPVAIHSGDTYSERALLEYSHPLRMDRLAVNWRNVTFIICHLGAPWVFDGCEVAYKNRNVCLDLSGLLIGNAEEVRQSAESRLWTERYLQAIALLNNYSKLLFGTDWPLAPLDAYIDFCKALIPATEHEAVFHDNAVRVFKLHA